MFAFAHESMCWQFRGGSSTPSGAPSCVCGQLRVRVVAFSGGWLRSLDFLSPALSVSGVQPGFILVEARAPARQLKPAKPFKASAQDGSC